MKSHRDKWVYNNSKKQLIKNINKTIDYCNNTNLFKEKVNLKFLQPSESLLQKVHDKKIVFDKEKIRIVHRRPFFKQWCYYDGIFTEMLYRTKELFPTTQEKNLSICVSGKGTNNEFSAFITNYTPDVHFIFNGQSFPRFTFNNGNAVDNILDKTLKKFKKHYKNNKISKDNIFYYVYGLLHSKEYVQKFQNNLSRELPHIPMLKDFQKFTESGRNLAELHLNYDTGKKYKLKYTYSKKFNKNNAEHFRVKKIRRVKNDKSILVYNEYIKIEGIPDDAHNYTINGRTPLEWIVDRYNVKTDPDSGITNDPNDWFENSKKLIDLIERTVYVSVETGKIIKSLPQIYTTKKL